MIRAFLASWAARRLLQHRRSTERELIRERARQLCAEMHRPIPEALR